MSIYKKQKTVAIVYHAKQSYSDELAGYIQEGVESFGLASEKYHCEYINDKLDKLIDMDAIVFGSPTYFGAASAEMKQFMDLTGQIWQKQLWKNKVAAAFTHSSALSGDKLSVLQQFFTFAQQHGMIWVGLDIESCQQNADKNKLNYLGSWSGLMALTPDGSKGLPYESETDKLTAQYFGARIAKITKGLDL